LTISARSIRRWGIACSLLFVFTFGCGMTALVSLVKMGPQNIPAAREVNERNPNVAHLART
jgi:hypothetical protein